MRYLAYAWAAFITIYAVTHSNNGIKDLVLFLSIGWIPALVVFIDNASDKAWVNRFKAHCNGVDPKFIWRSQQQGIALDEIKGELILSAGRLIKKYPFSDVREWQELSDGTGTYASRNGFYIKVKDIDHPEWHLSRMNKETRKRWFEIFNQKINRD